MTLIRLSRMFLVFLLLATISPAYAKPNSYPGENSKFSYKSPEDVAQLKAERAKRIEERKKRREERRRKRLNDKNNRLD